MMRSGCFRPLEELANLVRDPQGFREHVRDLIIFMNDQIPIWMRAGSWARGRMRTEGDERDESPIRLISRTVIRIPLSQSSTQPADSQKMEPG